MTAMSTSEMMPSTAIPATIFRMVKSMRAMVAASYARDWRFNRIP
jgi:hypothetical protein